MVDQLRLYLNRPLRDGDRPRLFALAVAVIAAGAAALSLLDDAGPAQRRAQPARTPAPTATAPAATPAAPRPSATPEGAPSEEGMPPVAASAADVQTAKSAARAFLAGYLPYSYGQVPARSIRGAAPALRRTLASRQPLVPAGERARTPRVRLLQSNGVSPRAAALLALVDDGARSYTVSLGLQRRASGRWVVTTVEG